MKSYKLFSEQKDSKQEAKYQDKPKGCEHCSICTMWRPPNGCSAVSGIISPNGWCSYFKRSKAES